MSYYGPNPPPGQPGPYGGSYGWNPQGDYPSGQPRYPQPGNSQPYMAQPGSLPLRQLYLGDYFSSMFATLRKSPGLFFGAALIFGSIAAILTATGEFFLTRTLPTNMMDPYAEVDAVFPGLGFGFIVPMLISQVVLALGQTFNWGMYSFMVARGAIGVKTSLSQGFRLLRGQWGRLIGLLALLAGALLAIYLIILVLVVLVAAIMFQDGDPDGTGIVLAVVAVLAIIFVPLLVALFFYIRWHLVIPAMVIEDIGIFAGLRRSWHLTRGYFWRTLGIALLFTVILGFVSAVITSPIDFISIFIVATAGTEAQLTTTMLIVNLVITAVSSLTSFLVTNLGVLISIFFYFDYRFRKEGLGIEFQQLASQQVDQTPDRFDTSLEVQPGSEDEDNDIIPGRHSLGLQQPPQPGPYGTYGPAPPQPPSPGYQPPQGPPPPPGPGGPQQ